MDINEEVKEINETEVDGDLHDYQYEEYLQDYLDKKLIEKEYLESKYGK